MNCLKKTSILLSALVLALLLASCCATAPERPAAFVPAADRIIKDEPIDWDKAYQLHPGILHLSLERTTPRINKIQLVRIDLTIPRLSLTASKRATEWGLPMPGFPEMTINTVRETTRDFMRHAQEHGRNMVVAFNGSGWGPWCDPWTHTFGCDLPFLVTDGIVVSDHKRNRPVFVFTKDGQWDIRDLAPGDDISNFQTAVGGYGYLVKEGKLADNSRKELHPRTAYGISKDKRYFYVLIVDGRQPGYSEGAAGGDLADLFLEIGDVWTAIGMDGGGSSTLVTWDPQTQKVQKLNHQRGGGERWNGCNLGFCIEPQQTETDK